ncbi:MAG TPA: hypothetical protein VGS07_00965 [Thermoanaerobaculia bacterium]|jgi:hypothetical protein|nr:hypothetical protein [Thermoanaerobaculia bacterium]
MTDPSFPRPGPLPILPLLDEGLRLTRVHLRAIFPGVAVPVAVVATLAGVVQAVDVKSLFKSGTPSPTLFWTPQILLAAVFLGLLSAVAYVAGQVAALDALAGRPVDMRRAWRFAARPSVWGTLLLSFLAILVSFLFCVLPVFFVAPLLAFAVPVMAEEERFGLGALSRSAELALFNPSRRLMEHPIVKVLLLMVVTTLISYLAGLVVALPFQLPMFIDLFRKALAGNQDITSVMARWIWLQIPAQFLSSLARTAIYIYTAFGMGLLYADVRGRKEGIDLRPEIDALFPAPAPSEEPWS